MTKMMLTTLLTLLYTGVSFSQELDNLEYCHESIDIRNVYFLEANVKVAVSTDLQSIYLLQGGNVIKDTLSITGDLLQSVSSLGPNGIVLNFMNYSMVVSSSDQKMKVLDTIDYRKLQFYPSSIYKLELMTGFRSATVKSKKHINYVHELRTRDGSITQITVNYPEIIKKSYSDQLIGTVYFDNNDPLIYITLEGAGKFSIYNYETQQQQVFTLQYSETKEHSWYVFYDAKTDQLHPIKFGKDGQNEVYSFDPKTQEMKPLMTVDFKPISIIDGKMHKRSLQEGDNGKLLCHYLVPLSTEKQGGTVILEAVEVSSN